MDDVVRRASDVKRSERWKHDDIRNDFDLTSLLALYKEHNDLMRVLCDLHGSMSSTYPHFRAAFIRWISSSMKGVSYE